MKEKRCDCEVPRPMRLDDKTVTCADCGGWIAKTVTTLAELEKFREDYGNEMAA